jgi:hypothetical protein
MIGAREVSGRNPELPTWLGNFILPMWTEAEALKFLLIFEIK